MSVYGLSFALGALEAQQQALDVVNHNIANANTPGFSRQRINLVALPAYTVPTMNQSSGLNQAGSGVAFGSIERIQDGFIDFQLRAESQNLEEARIKQQTFDRLQVIFNEPTETGLSKALSKFWGAWHDLSADPSDGAARAAVLQQGLSLSGLFNRSHEYLVTMRNDLGALADLQVRDVNSQIQRSQLAGANANDLVDQRDQLLDRLSQILYAKVVVNEDDTVSVFVDGQELVNRTSFRTLTSSMDTSFTLSVQWADTLVDLDPDGGQLQGVLTSANNILPAHLAALDDLATRLRDDVNTLHATGFDMDGNPGGGLFTGTGAGDFTVDTAIQASVDALAASGQPDAPGDGSVALAIAQLRHTTAQLAVASELTAGTGLPTSGVTIQRILVNRASPGATYQLSSSAPNQLTMSAVIAGVPVSQTVTVVGMAANDAQMLDFSGMGVQIALRSGGAGATAAAIIADLTGAISDELLVANRATITTGYQQQVVKLGIDARSVDADARNGEALLNNLERQRLSVSGVSLDEEAANLVKHLRAYQAAARVITIMDEMLETIIRGMGVGGRF